MVSVAQEIDTSSSPRSTVFTAPEGRITTNVRAMNPGNMSSDVAAKDDEKRATPSEKEAAKEEGTNPAATPTSSDEKEASSPVRSTEKDRQTPPTPSPPVYATSAQPSLTPQQQQGSGYYQGYLQQHQQQMTPEPPSPHPATDVYGSFFHQPSAAAGAFGVQHSNSSFGALSTASSNNAPLSPSRGGMPTVVPMAIPPGSPLFPRVNSGGGLEGGQQRAGAPPSPSLPYIMSPVTGSNSNMYQTYPAGGVGSHSSDEGGAWGGGSMGNGGDRTQNSYPSPQVGMPVYASRASRAYSFEDTMLPPSAMDPQDQSNPAYSPYGGSTTSGGSGTLFAQQWGYGGPPDIYSSHGSPLQPRPSSYTQMHMYPGMPGGGPAGGMRNMYGQYFQASSPGPPIQTTASNKGPDGANLFIFHIPNHFTNLDMYQLFAPYGNLLSVRIMVEKETGRSRGFGFVSYDNPESAAMAIKELNGFSIGNKRLKVQHKQIRPRDSSEHDRDYSRDSSDHYDNYGGVAGGEGSFHHRSRFSSSSLPPSGPTASGQGLWAAAAAGTATAAAAVADVPSTTTEGGGEGHAKQDEGTGLTSATSATGGDLHLGTRSEPTSPLANLGEMQTALPDIPVKSAASGPTGAL